MTDRWVVNASPVILLGKAEVIRFLPLLCDELVVPAGVVAEVQRGDLADAGRRWLAEAGREFVRPVLDLPLELTGWQGGMGEIEVIAWAMAHPGFTAILDDLAARRLAGHHGGPVVGSLRVIVRAKERGIIPAARPVLERLRGAGAYVSDELLDRAIALAGES